jgi:hypothetical protein
VLLAASNEHVVAEVTAANRIVEMTVRRYDSPMRYRLEVVLRGADALPAVVSVRYGSPESQRLLLVPLDRQEFGPPSGLIDLPDFGAGIPWEVSGPLHVESDTSWSAEILTASVRTAVTVATRDAWRRVRNIVSDEMGRIIDEALT